MARKKKRKKRNSATPNIPSTEVDEDSYVVTIVNPTQPPQPNSNPFTETELVRRLRY